MKTKNTNHSQRTPFYRRPVIIGVAIIILIIIIIVIIVFLNFQSKHDLSETTNDEPATELQATENESKTTESTIADDGWESKAVQYEGESANNYNELSGSISYASVDRDSGVLTVGTMLDQFLGETGTCTLSLRQGLNEVYSTTVDSFADVSTSACQDFHIPLSNIASGDYKIIITLSGNGKTGIIEGEVTL